MKTDQYKRKGHTVTPIISVGIGLGISVVVSLLLSAVVAWLVAGERVSLNAMGSTVILVQCISAFVGCTTAMHLSGKMPAIVASACAVSYFAMLVCTNILVLDSSLGGVGKGILAIFGGAVLAVLVQLVCHKNKKRKKVRVR